VKDHGIVLPQSYIDQVNTAIQAKLIKNIPPKQLLMNIVSLCLMPIVAKNMVQMLFQFDDDNFQNFLNERRQIIPEFILAGIEYKEVK
jgi:hypothetical protein